MTIGDVSVGLEAEVDRFFAQMGGAEKALDSFEGAAADAAREFSKLDAKLQKATGAASFQTGLKVAAAAATAAIGASVLAFAEFERGMTRVGAVTGSLGTPAMNDLNNAAQQLAQTTEFTARQVADAMGFMGQAGFTANQIMAATPGVLQLASAAMIDVAKAADITTNVVSGYGLAISDIGRANDVLIATMTNTNTDLVQLGQAFKFVGPVAKAAGLEFEEVSASIGLLGNAGLQATLAGTGLRGSITRLINPTKQQAELMRDLGLQSLVSGGKIKSLQSVIAQLEKSGANGAQIMALFGQRAGPAMQVLVDQGASSLATLQGVLENAGGTAESIAQAQLNTLSGQLNILKSVTEGAAIEVGRSLVPALRDVLIPVLSSAAKGFAEVIKFIGFFDENAETQIDAAADALGRRAQVITKLQGTLIEIERSPSFVGGDPDSLRRAENLRRRIGELTEDQKVAAKASQNMVTALDKGSAATDDMADGAKTTADEFERAVKAAEKLAKATTETLLKGGGLTGQIELLAGQTSEGRGVLEAGLSGDDLAFALGDLGAAAAEQAETLLLSAKTLKEFEQASAEAVHQGLLFAQDISEISDKFTDKLLGAADAGSDVDAAFGALGEQGFNEFLDAIKEGADEADRLAKAQVEAREEMQRAAGAGLGQALLNPKQFASQVGGDIGSAMGNMFSVAAGGLGGVIGGQAASGIIGALEEGARLVVDSLKAGISSIAQGVQSGFVQPILGTSGGASRVVGGVSQGVGAAGQISGGAGIIAGLAAAGAAAFGFANTVLLAQAGLAPQMATVAALAAPAMVPLATAAGVATVALGTLAGVATGGLAVTATLLAIGSQSEQAERFGAVLTKAGDIITNTAGNIFTSLLPIAGQMVLFAEAIAPVINRFTGLDQVVPILFNAIKATAVGVLKSATAVSFGFEALATSAINVAIPIVRMNREFEKTNAAVLRFQAGIARAAGFTDLANELENEAIEAVGRAANANAQVDQLMNTVVDLDATTGALRDATVAVEGTFLGDAIDAAGEAIAELTPPVDAAAESFSEMNEELFNTVRGMRVATQRLRASDPEGGMVPGAGGILESSGALAGMTIIIERLVSSADNAEQLFQEIQDRGRRFSQQVNASPMNAALEGVGFG